MDSSVKPVTYSSVAGSQYKYTDNVKIGGSSTTVVLPKVTTSSTAGDDSFWGSKQKPALCLSAWAFSSSPLTPQRTKCRWSNCTFRCCAVLPCFLFIMHECWIYSRGADSFFLDTWCVPLSDHVKHRGTKCSSVLRGCEINLCYQSSRMAKLPGHINLCFLLCSSYSLIFNYVHFDTIWMNK